MAIYLYLHEIKMIDDNSRNVIKLQNTDKKRRIQCKHVHSNRLKQIQYEIVIHGPNCDVNTYLELISLRKQIEENTQIH